MPPFNRKPDTPKNEYAKTENKTTFSIVSPEMFIEKVVLLPPALFAFLTPYSVDDYRTMNTKLFLSEDKESGFGLNPNGQLVSVFSLQRERGVILVEKAKEEGAKYLSCMGEKLVELYSSFGFKIIKKEIWNDIYAPKHWNYEKFGTPNIYEMEV